jgi:molybdopterin/thiamine biosynthesis adenylyltransferase
MPYEEKFSRNFQSLSAKQQERLRGSHLCVIGLGGTGGFALESLVRLGAEDFTVFDSDRFELTNFNRQLLATGASLGMKKTDAALSRARSINKKTRMKKYGAFGSKSARALAGRDVVLDCTDSIATKKLISDSCRSLGVPCVFCSAQGSRGMVSVFAGYPFGKAFQANEKNLASKSCASVLCSAAALAGTLAASQALNVILNKPAVRAPDALFFDIFDTRLFWKARLG